MPETSRKAILIVLASTVFTAAGQILYKKGAGLLAPDLVALATNTPLMLGFASYMVGAVMLIYSLKHGELSVLYPIYALNFIWVSMLSPRFFPADSMNALKWAGVVLVIAGVSLIGAGSGKGGEAK